VTSNVFAQSPLNYSFSLNTPDSDEMKFSKRKTLKVCPTIFFVAASGIKLKLLVIQSRSAFI